MTPSSFSGEWDWPLLTPRALAAGITMALAASTSSLGCYALCGQLLHLSPPPPHACNRGLSLEGLGSVLAGLLGSPLGTASSFPNVGTVSLFQVRGSETGLRGLVVPGQELILIDCQPGQPSVRQFTEGGA